MTEERSGRFALLGVGAAACLGCCAPPVLAFLGGVTVAGVAGTVVFGLAAGGLVIMIGLGFAIGAVVRRRRPDSTGLQPVSLPIPTRRDLRASHPGKRIPLYDESAPVACTIGTDETADRVRLLERLRANHSSLERSEHGIVVRFPADPGIEADVRQLTIDEKRCCAFFGFDVTTTPAGVTLRWDAPPDAAMIIDGLAGWFDGDAPSTALAGLL